VRGIAADVDSVGLVATGEAVSDGLAGILREWDIDLAGHRSRLITAEAVERADVVLTMEHYQVAEVALIAPDAWDRTFTLQEIVRRGQRVGRRAPNEDLADWFRRLSAGRTRMELVGAWHLDVADPAGQGSLAIEQTADEVQDLVDRLADLAWPKQRPKA
jgi:protein-tyrosine-phosphatase